LLAPIEDAASIATYGLREAVIEIPSVFCTGADATAVMARWAQSYLEINAYPFSKGTIKNVRQRFNIPLKPDGYVRLIQTDGTTIEAAARKVSYKISNELAITITVGDDKDRLSKTLAEMYRISEFASAIIEMNAEQ
jgi:flagellar basal body rod protein FlgF